MQARFGERPDALLWQRLDDASELSTIVEIASASGLARWIDGIDAPSDAHWIEISLRARWRECVAETAAWVPERWQAAVLWTSRLIDLPALCRLARGEAPCAWMSRDPALRPYAVADRDAREAKLRCEALGFAAAHWPAASAPAEDFEVLVRRAWRDAWRRLWPGRGDAPALEDLAALMESRFAEPAAAAREEYLHALRRRFRRATLRPTAAFAYLAFAALDIERLRAALLRSVLLRRAGLAS
jgi:hypothetical protein